MVTASHSWDTVYPAGHHGDPPCPTLTLQAVCVEQVLALLVALDATLSAAHALACDAPQQPLTLVAVGGRGGCPHFEGMWRGVGHGIDQRLQGLLEDVHLLWRELARASQGWEFVSIPWGTSTTAFCPPLSSAPEPGRALEQCGPVHSLLGPGGSPLPQQAVLAGPWQHRLSCSTANPAAMRGPAPACCHETLSSWRGPCWSRPGTQIPNRVHGYAPPREIWWKWEAMESVPGA